MQNDFLKIDEELNKSPQIIHVRIKQRNGRKCITTIEGLDILFSKDAIECVEKIAKTFRKKFNCSATVIKPELVIQLQGDQRKEIKSYLIDNKLVKESNIKIHGY